jgi:hypothetical protein
LHLVVRTRAPGRQQKLDMSTRLGLTAPCHARRLSCLRHVTLGACRAYIRSREAAESAATAMEVTGMPVTELITVIAAVVGTIASAFATWVKARAYVQVRRAQEEARRDIVRALAPGSRFMDLDGHNVIVDVGNGSDAPPRAAGAAGPPPASRAESL